MSDSDTDDSSIASENIDTANEYAIRKYHEKRRQNDWRHGCPVYDMAPPYVDKLMIQVTPQRSRVARLFSIEDWEFMGGDIAAIMLTWHQFLWKIVDQLMIR